MIYACIYKKPYGVHLYISASRLSENLTPSDRIFSCCRKVIAIDADPIVDQYEICLMGMLNGSTAPCLTNCLQKVEYCAWSPGGWGRRGR